MDWMDIACIIFSAVTMNHLGLIGEIERIIGNRIPIIDCQKCATFWMTLCYGIGKMGFSGIPKIPLVLAISFMASYVAIWIELLEGYIDTLYTKLYDKIYPTADTTDTDAPGAADPVPSVPE